ncbi:MAG TPA: ankyrin repeat domain-containing protein, partial [Planctomycetia bacterium]|nr:ankyrin repeat domain-containing protein [Planctomycetia bacterium]
EEARFALARAYDFADWQALTEFQAAASKPGSEVHRFETAIEATVDGDLAKLSALVQADTGLVRARSIRRMHFDPPVHRSQLLHYVGANGVEGFRQRTPPNATAVAELLLDAGAEVDGLADLYGGKCTTISLTASSCHPANAGVQVAIVETLLDHGAAIDGVGEGEWVSPLATALAFGYADVAEALVRRGARVENVALAAGMGMTEKVAALLPAANALSRHRATALAAQMGKVEALRLLLDAGEDPNRFNPEGNHSHSTPLHQAALAGHLEAVKFLVSRGARADIPDKEYGAAALGWAEHAGRNEVAAYLRALDGPS